jgi:6-hydroxycyclohex-1-ene-1-carbonyl-CoA dehydrogenase
MPTPVQGWKMAGPGRLERFETTVDKPGSGRVLIQIAGCGVCHTDIGYLYDDVPTKKPAPIILGHEVAGLVVEAGPGAEAWLGRRVIVPAVTPCGACRWCKAGRPTSCRKSVMLGNDEDGGFASHVVALASGLCPVDPPGQNLPLDAPIGKAGLSLWEVAVLADAVSTPFQAVQRSGLGAGELAIVVGCGGIGTYAVQIARAKGATVVAVDVDPAKLERATKLGASLTVNAKEGAKVVKGKAAELARSKGLPTDGWKVFETSGSVGGQDVAFGLLTTGGTLGVVGFTSATGTFRLSNVMAFDANLFGVWGCDPKLYPEALALIASGDVQVRGLIKKMPLADAPAVIDAAHRGEFQERVVLVP